MNYFVWDLNKVESGTLPVLGLGDDLRLGIDAAAGKWAGCGTAHCRHVTSDSAGDCGEAGELLC